MKSNAKVITLFALLLYLFIEGVIYAGLLIVGKIYNYRYDPRINSLSEQQKDHLRRFTTQREAQYIHQDPMLGWTNKQSRYEFSSKYGTIVYEYNSAGMRDNREYATTPSSKVIRLSAFGDSFTHGSDVNLIETWAKQLSSIDPAIEVLNYGVGAYGLDQAYLRYLEVGTEYQPHIVLIGYMSENIARNVNVFRPFYTRLYRNAIFTKPRFMVGDDALDLQENPLSTFEDYEYFLHNDTKVLAQLGEHDYHYQINYDGGPFDVLPSVRFAKVLLYGYRKRISNPIFKDGMYQVGSEAYQVTLKIFDAFYQEVIENGAVPIVLIFPDTGDQRKSRQGKARRYTPLLEDFDARGYRYIDLLGALEPYESQYTIDQLTRNWGHYSPLGNRIVAEYIHARLEAWGLTEPSNIKKTVEAALKSR